MFNSNGGSTVSNQTFVVGSLVTEPSDPTKSGYTFDAWYTDEALTEAFDFATVVTADVLRLYAKWTIITYDATYNSGSGASTTNPATFDVEDLPITLTDATGGTGTFSGWFTEAEFTNEVTEIDAVGDITLYGKWDE